MLFAVGEMWQGQGAQRCNMILQKVGSSIAVFFAQVSSECPFGAPVLFLVGHLGIGTGLLEIRGCVSELARRHLSHSSFVQELPLSSWMWTRLLKQ